MRKRNILSVFLLAAVLAFVQCGPQAEESTEDLSLEEQAAQALFFQLGLIDLGGIFWEGPAVINSCSGTTLEAGVYCGTIIAQGQEIQQDTVEKNFRLFYTSQAGASVTTKNYLVMPHFNGYPFGYEVLMSGSLSSTTNDSDFQLDLTQNAVSINPNTGYDILVSKFRVEKAADELKGSFQVVLSTSSINGDAVLQYNLTAKRGY